MAKLEEFKILKTEGKKTIYTMTDSPIRMTSIEMGIYFGSIRGFIEKDFGDFGETRVGVKFGVHKGYLETFSNNPFEVMNDMLTDLVTECQIKLIPEETEGDA
ncbi:hypothetical protein P4159_05750 [Bacillus thuringiensis]|uniref:hypothetical protein n=1 Tax=Bacillus cereus group TaxID=86661 RepID=UPI000CD8D1D0|nr:MULTISPECIES: hypothetical protein [Bacillus cereus group]MEC3417085.1 hypothetical protein [Bacillus cereus]MEC3596904.1 hypothetical protein [Bacillus thuringiensis]MED1574254.1 hypothetical protein [Bacillus paranthracis]MED1836177.1 hypothetical protein [Bacillus thuringiensis]MED2670240.1 hypothetical protein [Bacillus thuringiensis]